MDKPPKIELDKDVNTFPLLNPKAPAPNPLSDDPLNAIMDTKPMGSYSRDSDSAFFAYKLIPATGGVTETKDIYFGIPQSQTNNYLLGYNQSFGANSQFTIKKGGVYESIVSLTLEDIQNIQKIQCDVVLYNAGIAIDVLDRFILEGKVPSFSVSDISSCGLDGPCVAGGVSVALSQAFSELPYKTYNIRMARKVYIRRNPIGRNEKVGVRLSVTSGSSGGGEVTISSDQMNYFQLEWLKKQW